MPTLGADGPQISTIGLGGWEAGGGGTWGPNESDVKVIDALRRGFDEGATWVDTAEVYAKGRSEKVVGRALADRPETLVFTKVAPRPDGSGAGAGQVIAAIEGSLRRLKRDVIDLYQLHWRDPDVPIEETWTAMTTLVDRGLVRFIGLSNVGPDDVRLCESLRHVDSLQVQGSLLYRSELDWALPLCRPVGTAVLCYGSLAYGLLGERTAVGYSDWRSGTYGMDDFFVADNYRRLFSPGALPRMRGYVKRLAAVAEDLGLSTVQLSLAWLLAQPGVTGAIVGSRDVAHTLENVRAGRIDLSAQRLALVQELGLP